LSLELRNEAYKNKNPEEMITYADKLEIHIQIYNQDELNEDDKMSGLGESLKLALTGGHNCLNIFKDNFKTKNYINIIKMSTSVKKIIIEHDELERDERRVLNYGHTVGHALETATNYFLPHGISVLYGMMIKNRLFYNDKYKELNDYILEIIPETFKNIPLVYNNFLSYMLNDKKNKGNKICFILLNEIGESIFEFKELNEITDKLKEILKNYFNCQ
jgi:3-dehydroquinate synthase